MIKVGDLVNITVVAHAPVLAVVLRIRDIPEARPAEPYALTREVATERDRLVTMDKLELVASANQYI